MEVVYDTESMDGVEDIAYAEEAVPSDEGSEADQGFDTSPSFSSKGDGKAENVVQDSADETQLEGKYQYRHES